MDIPLELVTYIASGLESYDLGSFRLVSRRFAQAAITLIPRNGISVMNTTRDIQELLHILSASAIAKNVKILKIIHAEWPICSYREWETHHLLFGGNERMYTSKHTLCSNLTRNLSEKAFAAYKDFIREQQQRRYSDEVENIYEVFSMLPNLKTMQISSMRDYSWYPKSNRRFRALQKKIWLSPFPSEEVTRTVEAVLIASGPGMTYPGKLRALHISGLFDPGRLYIDHSKTNYPHIQHLKIHDLCISNNEKSIQRLLGAFPGLLTLSVAFQGVGPNIGTLQSLYWEKLQQLKIQGMWTSESEFADLLIRHEKTLKHFCIQDGALSEGSWEKLFTKTRKTRVQITLAGELYGRTSRETLDLECEHVRLKMQKFLEERDSVWPFKYTKISR